jgi:hypothetical protein
MSENTVDILTILFSLGSIPSSLLLVWIYIKILLLNPPRLKALLSAYLFFLASFIVYAFANVFLAGLSLLELDHIVLRYSKLLTLCVDMTWFTVSWAVYLVYKKE